MRYTVELKPGYSKVDHLFNDFIRHMACSYNTRKGAEIGYFRSCKKENKIRRRMGYCIFMPPAIRVVAKNEEN
jgi:hypothetical protein